MHVKDLIINGMIIIPGKPLNHILPTPDMAVNYEKPSGDLPTLVFSGGCCSDKPSVLSLKDLSLNAGLALSKYVIAGMPNLTRESREKRLATCENCGLLVDSRCSKCGCFVKIKSWMQTENCPEGKW